MQIKNLKPLALTFIASGIWDTIAGFIYMFGIGHGREINNPDTHPFYAVFLGSFFFCFAWIQFLSSTNIKRYAFVVGCLIFGRVFYIVQLYLFMLFYPGFPTTFAFSGIVDSLFVVSYLIFCKYEGMSFKDLFIPAHAKE